MLVLRKWKNLHHIIVYGSGSQPFVLWPISTSLIFWRPQTFFSLLELVLIIFVIPLKLTTPTNHTITGCSPLSCPSTFQMKFSWIQCRLKKAHISCCDIYTATWHSPEFKPKITVRRQCSFLSHQLVILFGWKLSHSETQQNNITL